MSQYKARVYEHKRNWVKYNENLIRRGELYLVYFLTIIIFLNFIITQLNTTTLSSFGLN